MIQLTRHRRSGYSLLEVVLALGLSALLLSVVYGSISLYSRLSTQSFAHIDRSRVARALFRKIDVDLKSVVFKEAKAEEDSGQAADSMATDSSSSSSSGTGGGATDPLASSVTASTAATSSVPASASASFGLIGDSQMLMLSINRPGSGIVYTTMSTAATPMDQTSDLRAVSYFLAAHGGGLPGKVAENVLRQRGGSLREASGVEGFARVEGDRFATETAMNDSETDLLAEGAELLAAEVLELQFRYFDGTAWRETWDSSTEGRLPQSVEVTMYFLVQDQLALGRVADEDPRAVKKTFPMRQVLTLPLSKPYVGLTNL